MVRLHLLFETAHLGFDIVDLFERRKRRGVDGFVRGEIDVLIEQAELEAVHLDHVARIGAFLAGDEAKNRRLAGTVTSDEADLFDRIHLKRNALEYLVAAVGFCRTSESLKSIKKSSRPSVAGYLSLLCRMLVDPRIDPPLLCRASRGASASVSLAVGVSGLRRRVLPVVRSAGGRFCICRASADGAAALFEFAAAFPAALVFAALVFDAVFAGADSCLQCRRSRAGRTGSAQLVRIIDDAFGEKVLDLRLVHRDRLIRLPRSCLRALTSSSVTCWRTPGFRASGPRPCRCFPEA